VPKEFIGRKYSKLFDSLTTRRYIIPVGLYRKVKVDLNAYKEKYKNQKKYKAGKGSVLDGLPQGNDEEDAVYSTFKYVVTNPEKTTKLRDDDKIFVLAKNDPGNPENWDDYTHQNKDMFDPRQIKIMSNISNMMHANHQDIKKGDKNQGTNG
jgi:hypothetical protein